MKMHAITADGELLEMTIKTVEGTAASVLKGIVPVEPMFIGKLADDAHVWAIDNGKKAVLFKMPNLKISTRYSLTTLDDGTKVIYPSWHIGMKARLTWNPPYGWSIYLYLTTTESGSIQQQLIITSPGGTQYPMLIKNVFANSIICTGNDTLIAEHTKNGIDLEKLKDMPKLMNDSNYNGDAGPFIDGDLYRDVFKWDANTNEQIMINSNYFETLCKQYIEVPLEDRNKIPSEMINRILRGV
jgi:hypothetical protein